MNPWVVRPRRIDAPSVRLICFPYAGGGTIPYRKWVSHLSSSIDLCILNFPGREDRMREPCVVNYRNLMDSCKEAIKPLCDVPYILFGHSFGALTAYLIATEFQREGMNRPLRLCVSGREPPQVIDKNRINPHQMTDEALFAHIAEEYQGIPDIFFQNSELKAIFMSIMQQDFFLYEDYYKHKSDYPLDVLNCSLTAFGFREDTYAVDNIAKWQACSSSKADIVILEGGHFELFKSPYFVVNYMNQVARG